MTRDFHESYYEHSCSVMPDRDVLESDIRGRSFSVKLQRWWHGLFLLSCADERSRLFYTSSYSMKKERQRHYRKFCGRIHPLSTFRNFWDRLMMFVFIMNKITFHHNSSFVFGELLPCLYYIGAVLEAIIIGDIFVNIATGYIDTKYRKIILDKRFGVIHYCSTKLCLHVASAIPLQWLILLRFGSNFHCALCKCNRFTFVLEVISTFNLFRLYEYSSYCSRERRSIKLTYFLKILRVAVLGFFTMCQFIELGDVITLRIMVEQNQIQHSSYVAALLRNRHGVSNPQSPYKFYVFDFSRMCNSILLFSFASLRVIYYMDKIISLIAYMIANFFYFWTIMECYELVCRLNFPEDSVIINRNSTMNMVQNRQLPDKVTAKLYQYYDFKLAKLKAIEKHNNFLKSLPECLRRDIFTACYSRFIKKIPYFAEWPEDIKDKIVHMLKEEFFQKHDLVAEPWVQSDGLHIVAAGELAVYSEEIEVGHLIDGDYFGELSLVTDREVRNSSAIALTHCLVLILSKASFRRFMRQHPVLFFEMKKQLKDTLLKINSSSDSILQTTTQTQDKDEQIKPGVAE